MPHEHADGVVRRFSALRFPDAVDAPRAVLLVGVRRAREEEFGFHVLARREIGRPSGAERAAVRAFRARLRHRRIRHAGDGRRCHECNDHHVRSRS